MAEPDGREQPASISAAAPANPLHHYGLSAFALVLCAVAGFFLAEWLAARRDATPLARICARVDYINGL
jgi:hypothetical protein